ncbi:hypothetical protein [Sphingomonas koreensis]
MEATLDASELDGRMRLLRDEQLAEMAFSTPADGIREEAVRAAKAELDRRGVSASEMSELEFHVTADNAEDIAKPDAPMGLKGILFFLILGPALAISLGGAAVLYGRGYKRKSQEALICILFSFLIYGAISALFALFA